MIISRIILNVSRPPLDMFGWQVLGRLVRRAARYQRLRYEEPANQYRKKKLLFENTLARNMCMLNGC